jgi:hypothetical protein
MYYIRINKQRKASEKLNYILLNKRKTLKHHQSIRMYIYYDFYVYRKISNYALENCDSV